MVERSNDYFDLGSYWRSVSSHSDQANNWFNRGLLWTYGFNHGEAIACFAKAAEADPNCAMAEWGIGYAAGPNYNLPWHRYDEVGKAKALAEAYDAAQRALGLIDQTSPVEKRLIQALQMRYPQRQTLEDQSPWDQAFADAMRDVFAAFPDDLDVRAIFVEALMNLSPWQMWDLKTGCAAEGAATEEARSVLEAAFANQSEAWDHPGLLHLYVHLMEMSPFPEKALRAADKLRSLVPDAGHLIHMPTHIDVLCGDYHSVLHFNEKAIEADLKYLEYAGSKNVYTLYRIHDYHFAIYGAMFLGQLGPALRYADALIASAPEEVLRIKSPPMADFMEGYLSMKQHVLIRFGRWDEIIAQELPSDPDLYAATTAFIWYAKAVAYAATGAIAEARTAKEAFLRAKSAVPETRLIHNNKVVDLLAIAEQMLLGELLYRQGDYDAAFRCLRASVALDDALAYDEPWGWMQPTRHALGALLLEQDHAYEAEAVYRADLGLDGSLPRSSQHPDNVWSLHGLHECLGRRGETVERPHIKQKLDLALARADVPIKASCFCRQAKLT